MPSSVFETAVTAQYTAGATGGGQAGELMPLREAVKVVTACPREAHSLLGSTPS